MRQRVAKTITEQVKMKIEERVNKIIEQQLNDVSLPPQTTGVPLLPSTVKKTSKSKDDQKWKDSFPIPAAANPTYSHLTTATIQGYYVFKHILSQEENTLLYSITKAAIENKIVNPIVEADTKLHKGTDGLLLWEKVDQLHEEQHHDYATLLRMLKNIQDMSKHPNESTLTCLNRFTAAINKLRNAVTVGGTIQLPPNHMLAYYLIDGLRFPKEYFLPILSDLKKNNDNARE
eukprot:602528-Ditylum_brightwellii.AAC.2